MMALTFQFLLCESACVSLTLTIDNAREVFGCRIARAYIRSVQSSDMAPLTSS